MPNDFHLCHQCLRLLKFILAVIADSTILLSSEVHFQKVMIVTETPKQLNRQPLLCKYVTSG